MSAPRDEAPDAIRALAETCAEAALDKKATDVVMLDVRGLTSLADWFVLASGRSDTQVRAIAESVEEACRGRERRPLCVEGLRHGQWVLLDYGDVVVHVFYGPVREFYDLERLWAKAPRIAVEAEPAPPAEEGASGRGGAR
ncbi:ribosome silencing factor [bacterium]|nr:ribosome silencing factor [bacterium]